jgi:SpoVK/Ycf46/Vps4 family AAA+-type ATPase
MLFALNINIDEEARPVFRRVLQAIADDDCWAFLKAKASFYSMGIEDAHAYVIRALDCAFSSGTISRCNEVIQDQPTGQIANHLSQALRTLESFAEYDFHPDVIFAGNYPVLPTTDEERRAVEREANFEQAGFESVGDVLSDFHDKVLGYLSLKAAEQIARLSLTISNGLSDAEEGRLRRHALEGMFEAAGWTGKELLQRVRRLASTYGSWASRVQRQRHASIGAWSAWDSRWPRHDVTSGSLREEFTYAKLVLPPYAAPPDGGYFILCTVENELRLAEPIIVNGKVMGWLRSSIEQLDAPATPRARQPPGRAAQPDAATGPQPPNEKEQLIAASHRAELNALEGLQAVKRSLGELQSLLAIDAARRRAGLPAARLSLHAIFAGNPGTGKTTVARIYAAMLHDFGYVRKGHLVETDRGGLIAEYLGQTAPKTQKILEQSLGGVLFIDEAYALKQGTDDTYGQECIDTILKFMEDHRDEFVLILAGYKDRMDALLETNPGFKSRFPQYLFFEDYTDEELSKILLGMAAARGYTLSKDTTEAAIDSISRERAGKYFGNARTVRNVLEQAERKQAARLHVSGNSATTLTREQLMRLEVSDLLEADIPTISGEGELERLIGLLSVKRTVRDYQTLIKAAKARGQDPRKLLQPYFVMTGNPGTGKTTVARIMGHVFKELGYLPSDHVVETGREDLVAGYIGQTAIKTRTVLEKALGGTLFIDEAYSLTSRQAGGQDYGSEAIETLLKFMEDNRGRLVIIAAGYDREMRDFLNANPGLRSRFTNVINFPDYSPEDCATIFLRMLPAEKFSIDDDARASLTKIFEELRAAPNWSNGRDVRTLLEFVSRAQARRLASAGGAIDQYLVITADINDGLRELVQNKQAGA